MIIIAFALVVINICLIVINVVMVGSVIREYQKDNPGKDTSTNATNSELGDKEKTLSGTDSPGQRESPDPIDRQSQTLLSFSLDLPKIENEGEDAPPLLRTLDNGFVLGVFDGMGGAGAEVFLEDDQKHTGAYFASRTVKDTVEQYALNNNPYCTEMVSLSNTLKEKITAALQTKRDSLKGFQSLLVSKMVKTLPTTMAVSFISNEKGKWKIRVLWAGDSRIYLLAPRIGLCQLTKDDLSVNQDPFQNLYNDSSLNNMVNLSQDFTINYREYEADLPCVVFASSDGCFGYLASPMHFESLLLHTMFASDSVDEWKLKLAQKLGEVACDDCTMSLLSNMTKYETLKDVFSKRYQFISQEMNIINKEIMDVANKKENDKNVTKEILEKHWNTYKTTNYFC